MLPEAVIFILLFINLTVSEVILTKPEDIHSKDLPEHIVLGMMIINMRKEPTISSKFKKDIDMMMDSMLSWSSGTPLHFIVITDERSVREAEKVLRDTISKCVSLCVIRKRRTKRKYRIPKVKMTFVDIKDITEGNEEFINAMKSNTDKGILSSEFNEKYFHDLFYLGPVYHNKFINIEKFIFLDVDLVFQTDIKKLENQFSKFDLPGGSCIGVGPDLSPHYLHKLKEYRKENPGTIFGDPGRFQGFNTGVTLYHLECLRDNAVYNEYLQPDKVSSLVGKFKFSITLGDQDWFTLLGFQDPSLFHPLGCEYNAQTSMQYLTIKEYKDVFRKYNYCVMPHEMMVQHRNGCGPKVENCRKPEGEEN